MSKLWGGVHVSHDQSAVNFASASDVSASIPPEAVLIPYDIQLNLAHASMLHEIEVISNAELELIKNGLEKMMSEYESGDFTFDEAYEDIHSQIEAVLTERIGEAGKKIHTGRSRNDQITTDMYLYLHDQIRSAIESISELNSAVEQAASEYLDVVCPGFTHHQKAVVTSLGDVLMSYKAMFSRDIKRLKDVKKLYDFSPLGAATGYGSLIPVDMGMTAKNLGFKQAFESSIDCISTRGEFEAVTAQAISQFMTHVSMFAQTFITFSSQSYGYIVLADEYTTGSSVMPQKKNPDILEIMKAKNVYIQSLSNSLSSLMQAAFIGYNRDSQYSKMIIMHIFSEFKEVPFFLRRVVETMSINRATMKKAASGSFTTSTGLMELLVIRRKLAMRDAKRLIEKAVANSAGDTIDLQSFNKAVKEMNIPVNMDDVTLKLWQQPEYQLKARRFGV